MTRIEFSQHRQRTLKAMFNIVKNYHRSTAPPYKLVISQLHAQGLTSSWGNGRYKYHGGASTGAIKPEGKKRVSMNSKKQSP